MKKMKHPLVLGLLTLLVGYGGWTQTVRSIEQDLKALDQASNDAQVKKDRATLERLWGEDYLYTHSNGSVMNKAQDIADTMSGEMTWTAAQLDNLQVKLYGDVGIVTGRLTMQGAAKQYASGPRRFTDIFVKRKGQWQLVGGQTTLLPTK
jgi:ketosteroid isomerase-like protein